MGIRVAFDAIAGGNVTVGYYQENGTWYALARQFDLLGSGPTREAAFAQLKELVSDYVEECITWGVERFFNPTPDDEWRRASGRVTEYLVILSFTRYSSRQKALPQRLRTGDDLTELAPFRDRFAGAALAAV